ncbi:MAG: phosphatidylserine/phosphatidylglycerophosphate/cardiolipin synthase family protein [Candidatus Sericytochromatia bacterium]|nr:phosphatidylserine/phosphatidylglycerophosphate/cardiolipin synthase family protein [Candidatus Sericytochromatia bacterium]
MPADPPGKKPVKSTLTLPTAQELKAFYKTQKANGINPLKALAHDVVELSKADRTPSTGAVAAQPFKLVPLARWNGITPTGQRPLQGATANTMALSVRSVGRVTQGNQVQLYVDGRTAFPALEKLIDGAKKTLYIETMIWHNDETGKRLAQKVVDAHKRGVAVKVIVDSVGLNFGTGRNNDLALMEWMRAQGVDAYAFNPNFVSKDGVAITHHKLYIADNEQFLSGGINIGKEYEHEWHDMLFGVKGPAAHTVAEEFAINWGRTTGHYLTIPPLAAAKKSAKSVPANAAVGFAVTDPIGRRYELKRATLQLINEAKHHVQIQMPYCSDDDLMRALQGAAKRGVTVDFIMPGTNDTGSYRTMNRAEAHKLLKAGANVRFFAGGTVDGREISRFSHTKMLIIDETVAVVGSGNADYRTFHNNNELNAYIADPKFVATLRAELFEKDWKESRAATRKELEQRPLKEKLMGHLYETLDRFF